MEDDPRRDQLEERILLRMGQMPNLDQRRFWEGEYTSAELEILLAEGVHLANER